MVNNSTIAAAASAVLAIMIMGLAAGAANSKDWSEYVVTVPLFELSFVLQWGSNGLCNTILVDTGCMSGNIPDTHSRRLSVF